MGKCTRKDGKLIGCKEMEEHIDAIGHIEMIKPWEYCPYCGADISKPEPEVIIKKSGGTWVARYDGVDYLWVATAMLNIDREKIFVEENGRLKNAFKPISEIEITDEISKLRPVVIHKMTKHQNDILYGVNKDMAIILDVYNDTNSDYLLSGFRLATTADLED